MYTGAQANIRNIMMDYHMLLLSVCIEYRGAPSGNVLGKNSA